MKSPKDYVEHLFSRGVLGSVLVGAAAGKIVEKSIIIAAPDDPRARLIGWAVAFVVFVFLYGYWAEFEDFVDDATGESDG